MCVPDYSHQYLSKKGTTRSSDKPSAWGEKPTVAQIVKAGNAGSKRVTMIQTIEINNTNKIDLTVLTRS